MHRLVRVGFYGLIGGIACALAFAAPADQAVSCAVTQLALTRPAYMVVDAVIRGDRLLLPDYTNGLREIDLHSGRDLRSVLPMGVKRGEVSGPQHLGCGAGRCIVWGVRYYWLTYDSSWKILDEKMAADASPSGQPLVFDDRMVVFGTAQTELGAGIATYLFIRYDDGSIVPLQEYPRSMAMPDVVKRVHFQGVVSGGLAALPDGGWAFVDPRTYTVFVFDAQDRLTATWRGANPHFRSPNWGAYTLIHDDSGRESFSRWQLAQPLVKRPVVLGNDLLGIVVGVPEGPFRQRHELDLYRMNGEPVSIGVPIPEVVAGRLIVADADRRRLVLVGQETWEPGAPTSVWTVEVSIQRSDS